MGQVNRDARIMGRVGRFGSNITKLRRVYSATRGFLQIGQFIVLSNYNVRLFRRLGYLGVLGLRHTRFAKANSFL